MPDEKDNLKEDWSMPEPVYRSTEGRDLRAERYASELPTETADRDLQSPGGNLGSQTIPPKIEQESRSWGEHKRSFWERNAAGLIVLAVLVLGALLYAVWFYGGQIF